MTTERFEIQENDIVGACVMDKGSVSPLYLVEEDTNDNIAVSGRQRWF